jgi:sugar-specific transcriptional regulator TrmB
MSQKFIDSLQNIGVTAAGATIYCALLKSPKMTVSEISRLSNIKRSTCYEHLDILLKRDLIVRVPIGKRMLYSATHPKKILLDVHKQVQEFEESIDEMSRQFDETTHRPKVVFYEGKREIKKIYDDLFKTVGDVYSIFPPQAFFDNFTENEYDQFDKLINDYAFRSRDLIVDDKFFKKVDQIRKENGMGNKVTKKLPRSFKSSVDVLIYGHKVALISLNDLSGLVIDNHDIAELFKELHGFIWKASS